jgi:hypothetical protein
MATLPRLVFSASTNWVVTDTTPPTLSSANIPTAGTTLNIVFSESVTIGAGGNGGFTIAMSGGAVTLTYASGANSNTLVYTLSRTVNSGETCSDFDYTQPTNGVEDIAGNDLATFSNQHASVTNNSTQTPAYNRFEERCEGTGTPSGWTDGGSPDWDNTTALVGSQSLLLASASDNTYTPTFTSSSELWVHFVYRFSAIPASSTTVFAMRESGTHRPYMSQRTTTGVWRIYNGGGTYDSPSFTPTAGTTYYVWWRYKAGTGAGDGISQVYISTSSTRPGSPDIDNQTTNATASINSCWFGGATGIDIRFDNMIGSSGEIPTNP